MEEFEFMVLGEFDKDSRMKQLRAKSRDKGLRGDEVFEFIVLEVKHGTDEIQTKLDKADHIWQHQKTEIEKLEKKLEESKIEHSKSGKIILAKEIWNQMKEKMKVDDEKIEKLKKLILDHCEESHHPHNKVLRAQLKELESNEQQNEKRTC